jgi:hypothetical protein
MLVVMSPTHPRQKLTALFEKIKRMDNKTKNDESNYVDKPSSRSNILQPPEGIRAKLSQYAVKQIAKNPKSLPEYTSSGSARASSLAVVTREEMVEIQDRGDVESDRE